jgi:hypothetical protein
MSADGKKYTANSAVLQFWTVRDKCWMCKHRFEKHVLLPVVKKERGAFQPNINIEVLFHLADTHGLPADTVREWIIGSVYNMEINEIGIKGFKHDSL